MIDKNTFAKTGMQYQSPLQKHQIGPLREQSDVTLL